MLDRALIAALSIAYPAKVGHRAAALLAQVVGLGCFLDELVLADELRQTRSG